MSLVFVRSYSLGELPTILVLPHCHAGYKSPLLLYYDFFLEPFYASKRTNINTAHWKGNGTGGSNRINEVPHSHIRDLSSHKGPLDYAHAHHRKAQLLPPLAPLLHNGIALSVSIFSPLYLKPREVARTDAR